MSSRRSFLQYMAALPVAASTASLVAMADSPNNISSNEPGTQSPERSGKVALAITFTGPSVSIVEGDDVIIFFPKLEDHDGGVGTTLNEAPLAGNADYEVFGLPQPTSESKILFPPLRCNAQEPYAQARKRRNFTIRLRRPDIMQGTHPVDVFLSDQSAVPPDAPMQTFPTALRFIYRNFSRSSSLQISGPGSFLFEPSFELDQQAGVAVYELKFQYSSVLRRDPCHRDATASFKKLLELFPVAGNVQTIKFAHDDPKCSLPSEGFVHTAFLLKDGPDGTSRHAQLMRVIGPGNDCQSPDVGHW